MNFSNYSFKISTSSNSVERYYKEYPDIPSSRPTMEYVSFKNLKHYCHSRSFSISFVDNEGLSISNEVLCLIERVGGYSEPLSSTTSCYRNFLSFLVEHIKKDILCNNRKHFLACELHFTKSVYESVDIFSRTRYFSCSFCDCTYDLNKGLVFTFERPCFIDFDGSQTYFLTDKCQDNIRELKEF